MIQDCLDIFKKSYEKCGERLILDNYVPKDGTYVMAEMGDSNIRVTEQLDIRYDKKNGVILGREDTAYDKFKFLDYHSKLMEMNKPIDPLKLIHSNNYLSFALKKESLTTGKLTEAVVDGYYNILLHPQLKYIKKNARALYEEVEQSIGAPNEALIELARRWIKQFLLQLAVDASAGGILKEPINVEGKDYLKLFFVFSDWRDHWEHTENEYRKENQRYLIPNIYNNNDYNVTINGQIYGLPNDNVGMNSKKPYLANRSRKVEVPCLLNQDEVVLQSKFYDYLMGVAAVGYVHIYFDTDANKISPCKIGTGPGSKMNGYFLRLRKGKEVEIHHADTVVDYNPNMKPPFVFKEIIETQGEQPYGNVSNRFVLEGIMDDVFFGKALRNNYFTKPEDLSLPDGTVEYNLLAVRDQIHTWVYKDAGLQIASVLEWASANLICNSIKKEHWRKAQHQLNLRWSFMDYFSQGEGMENAMNSVVKTLREYMDKQEYWDFEKGSDLEYYYAVGQLVSFLLSKSRAKDKPMSFVNMFLNAGSDEEIKKGLSVLFRKYDYAIPKYDIRFSALYSAVKMYVPETDLHTGRNMDMLEAGFVGYNFIFKKKESGKDAVSETNAELETTAEGGK